MKKTIFLFLLMFAVIPTWAGHSGYNGVRRPQLAQGRQGIGPAAAILIERDHSHLHTAVVRPWQQFVELEGPIDNSAKEVGFHRSLRACLNNPV